MKHHHEQTKQKGRHRKRIHAVGYWIIGEKRLVNRVMHACVTCTKLRGRLKHQKMADLPSERLTPVPPFTYFGLGPWQVVTRRTMGGTAKNKRWAVMFTCLTVRAVHIGIIEAMTPSEDSLLLGGQFHRYIPTAEQTSPGHGQSWRRLLKR